MWGYDRDESKEDASRVFIQLCCEDGAKIIESLDKRREKAEERLDQAITGR
jgi:hypothetical protein